MSLRTLTNWYTPKVGLGLICVLSALWLVGVAYADPANQTIRQGLAGTQIDNIISTPITGIYEVKAGNNIFYSDSTGRYLIFGHLYDTATQTDLTTHSQGLPASTTTQTSSNIRWSSLPQDTAIITGKKGGIPVAVFLDPDCPYCKALQEQLIKNDVLEVHEFLMPITELHPDAQNDANTIWCSQDREKTLIDVMTNDNIRPLSTSTCDTSGLDEINQFAQAHGFNATPILIRQNGDIHFGYLSLSELTAWAMVGEQEENNK